MADMLLKRNPEKDIPLLLKHVDNLIKYTQKILENGIEVEEQDHFSIVLHGFICKQLDHLKSIRTLASAGHHMDALLITRSMIEGLCILLWAAKDPKERSIDLRSFAWIDEYRYIRKLESNGLKVDPSYKSYVDDQLKVFGNRFYTAKAKDSIRQQKTLPSDPYLPRPPWENISQICKETDRSLIYLFIYKEASQWVHWTPDGIDCLIQRKEDTVTFKSGSYRAAAIALANGFESLARSMRLFDSHLKLGLDKDLNKLEKDYSIDLFGDKAMMNQ